MNDCHRATHILAFRCLVFRWNNRLHSRILIVQQLINIHLTVWCKRRGFLVLTWIAVNSRPVVELELLFCLTNCSHRIKARKSRKLKDFQPFDGAGLFSWSGKKKMIRGEKQAFLAGWRVQFGFFVHNSSNSARDQSSLPFQSENFFSAFFWLKDNFRNTKNGSGRVKPNLWTILRSDGSCIGNHLQR